MLQHKRVYNHNLSRLISSISFFFVPKPIKILRCENKAVGTGALQALSNVKGARLIIVVDYTNLRNIRQSHVNGKCHPCIAHQNSSNIMNDWLRMRYVGIEPMAT